MSLELATSTEQPHDLPPRTWRRWWLAKPKWLRIGCWAAFGMVLLHVALAVRIAIGLIEEKPIKELHQGRNTSVIQLNLFYAWERSGGHFFNHRHYEWYCFIMAGLCGRSCSNVEQIELLDHNSTLGRIATDRDLELIGDHFPNVQLLHLNNGNISARGVANLRACRRLQMLNLSSSDIDDNAVEQLLGLPSLMVLDLSSTRVTDAVIPILQRMKLLNMVNLGSTDVTMEAIEKWRSAAGAEAPVIHTDHRQVLPELLRVSVRWAGGEEDDHFAPPDRNSCGLYFENPQRIESGKPYRRGMGFNSLSQMSISSRSLENFLDDGKYRVTVDLVGCFSDPLEVEISRDVTTTQRLQFVMPVTKKQALEKWQLERKVTGK